MAICYIRSGAGGAGTGVDWANAYTTVQAAITAQAAGDTLYISEDHLENGAAALTVTFKGTTAAPTKLICVNHLGSVPPASGDLATTAVVSTTGNFGLTLANSVGAGGWVIIYGVQFSAGSGIVAAVLTINNPSRWDFINCLLAKRGTTGHGSAVGLGTSGIVRLKTTKLEFGAATDNFNTTSARLIWEDTPLAIAGTAPTSLITGSASSVQIRGVDLSAVSTSVISTSSLRDSILTNCKLAAGATMSSTSVGSIIALNCDSGATNYLSQKSNVYGSHVTETTIVRTGGATDGTTPVSWKIVTGSAVTWSVPFTCLPLSFWNDSTNPQTITIYGIWGGAAVPNNDEIWIEVEYMGSALTPISLFVSSTKADILAAGVPVAADTSTWGGSTTAFKLISPSFTPAMKGPIMVHIKAGKATSTFYVDPRPYDSDGVPFSKSYAIAPGVYVGESGGGGFGPLSGAFG